MKAYMRHILALLATVFGSQAALDNQSRAQNPAESQAWDAARAEGTRRAYESYLAAYPVGQHAREAFTRIVQMSGDADLSSNVEELIEGDVFSILPTGGGVRGAY